MDALTEHRLTYPMPPVITELFPAFPSFRARRIDVDIRWTSQRGR
ncbi:hypothetical protein [Gordonia sp. SID5947]|nr:hypothetical protein [Gordonia sp. SID5947]